MKDNLISKLNRFDRQFQRAKHISRILGWAVRGSLLFVFVITIVCVAQGCSGVDASPSPEPTQMGPFAIYLMPTEYLFDGIVVDDCNLLGSALLEQEDIMAYSWSRHDIVLLPIAGQRLAAQDLAGKPFVICVGDVEIYRGEIMALYMSRSSDKVVILWPPKDVVTTHFTIQLGYPGADFFVGADPRADEQIKAALITAGVLQE